MTFILFYSYIQTEMFDTSYLLLQTGTKQAEKSPVKRLSYTAETGAKAGRHAVTGNSDYNYII